MVVNDSFMRTRSKVLVVLGMLVLALGLGYVIWKPREGVFREILVFGDSLSDVGNVYIFSEKTNPKEPYFEGRFSDGLLWIEVFAERMGLEVPKPSLAGGTNYAYGGARTGDGNRDGKPDMGMQVKQFLEKSGGKIEKGQLVVVCGGCNDFVRGNPLEVVPNLVDHITELAKAGGKTFLVSNFPPIGGLPVFTHEIPIMVEASVLECLESSVDPEIYKYLESKLGLRVATYLKKWIPTAKDYLPSIKSYMPVIAGEIAKRLGGYAGGALSLDDVGGALLVGASAVSEMYNDYLELALGDLERRLGVKIYRLDFNGIFRELATNREKYGIVHVEKPALDAVTHELPEGVDPNDYMFFDGIHPVSKTHRHIAEVAVRLFEKGK